MSTMLTPHAGISTDKANWRSYALLFQHVCTAVNELRREEAAADDQRLDAD